MLTTASRPAATASRTASRLSTAGPAPARTACRIAVVVVSRSAGAASSLPGPRRPAQRGVQRLPGAGPLLPFHQRGGGQLGRADRRSPARPRVVRADHHGQPVGGRPPGIAARAARPAPRRNRGPRRRSLTRAATASLFAATRVTSAGARRRLLVLATQRHQPAGQQVLGHGQAGRHPELGVPGPAQAGDAGVQLGRPARAAGRPSPPPATPAGVSRDPRGSRSSSTAPTCASIARSRADAACWLIPACRAAAPMLPYRATASRTAPGRSARAHAGSAAPCPTIDRSQDWLWVGRDKPATGPAARPESWRHDASTPPPGPRPPLALRPRARRRPAARPGPPAPTCSPASGRTGSPR